MFYTYANNPCKADTAELSCKTCNSDTQTGIIASTSYLQKCCILNKKEMLEYILYQQCLALVKIATVAELDNVALKMYGLLLTLKTMNHHATQTLTK